MNNNPRPKRDPLKGLLYFGFTILLVSLVSFGLVAVFESDEVEELPKTEDTIKEDIEIEIDEDDLPELPQVEDPSFEEGDFEDLEEPIDDKTL